MTTSRSFVLVALVLAWLLAATRVAGAQSEKLAGRFPPATEQQLRAIVDSAQHARIPSGPLVQRALEGAARAIEPARIVSAVRALHDRLVVARRALGDGANETELVAAASALYVGVSPDTLATLRREHRGARSIALPLIVLADMVQQGVPRDTATGIILAFNRAGLDEQSYTALRQAVLLDIRSGVPPAAAAAVRARGALLGSPAAARPGVTRTLPSAPPSPVSP